MTELEKLGGFDFSAFTLGLLTGFVLTFVPTMVWGVEKWHERACVEQFNQAETASDSLSVVREDPFCLRPSGGR